MATTDLHAQVLDHDYYADAPAPGTGLAAIATLVRRLRHQEPNHLLLDNGDFLQGNPMADLAARDGGAEAHPVVAAMNALAYDAGTLGNHEFNYGLAVLDRALGAAAFPVVSANIRRIDGNRPPLVAPWVVLKRLVVDADGVTWPLNLGVIGFAPPQIAVWERLHLGGTIATDDIVTAARREVPRLRAAGAEVVIALCHSGIGPAIHIPGMENAALPLAAVDGIDALVVGHTHGVFPTRGMPPVPGIDPETGTLHGKPAVMAGALGSHLGVIDLDVVRDGRGWRCTGHRVEAIPASGPAAGAGPPVRDPAVVAAVAQAHRRTLGVIRSPIGTAARPIDSHFALLRADDSLLIVADAQRAYARDALAGTRWAGLPLLSAVAPFRSGGRGGPGNYLTIPDGPLSMRHAAELYIYPNTLCVVEATGAMVADWLERAAGLFHVITPGLIDQPLIDPAFPSYNFDVLDGLTWTIDPTLPPGVDALGQRLRGRRRRVRDIRHDGRPLRPQDRFAVVTNSYRAGGGGGFAAAAQATLIHHAARPTREVVIDYLRDAGAVAERPAWRFAALPGTAAWFDTSPAARRERAGDLALDDLGPAPGGFRRFRLHF